MVIRRSTYRIFIFNFKTDFLIAKLWTVGHYFNTIEHEIIMFGNMFGVQMYKVYKANKKCWNTYILLTEMYL